MRVRVAMISVGLVLSCAATGGDLPPAAAGRQALAAFDAVVAAAFSAGGERILGMAGFHGDPRPGQWLVLVGQPGGAPELREVALGEDGVVAERKIVPLPGQDLPRHPLERASIRIDSDEAFRVAAGRARETGRDFLQAHFHLRARDGGSDPVWLVQLLGRGRRPVGRVYLSAVTGAVLRESWDGRSTEPMELSLLRP